MYGLGEKFVIDHVPLQFLHPGLERENEFFAGDELFDDSGGITRRYRGGH